MNCHYHSCGRKGCDESYACMLDHETIEDEEGLCDGCAVEAFDAIPSLAEEAKRNRRIFCIEFLGYSLILTRS